MRDVDDLARELDRLRTRYAARDMRAELERTEVADWRLAGRSDFLDPLPLIAQTRPSCRGGWVERGESIGTERVGLDADGRLVAVVRFAGTELERPGALWRYEDDAFEVLDTRWALRAAIPAGRVTWAGRDDSGVMLLSASRVDGARVEDDGTIRPFAREWDGDRILVARGEPVASVSEALAAAVELVPEHLLWDGRTQRPEPWPDDPEALAEPLARALDGAIRAAAAAVDEPFCVEVRIRHDDPSFPPFARIGGRAFRDRMRRAKRQDGEAMTSLYLGVESGDVAMVELADGLDEEALRACRALSTALGLDSPRARTGAAIPIAETVCERLAEQLNAAPWPGAAEPFLALVYHGERNPLELARRSAGDARVDAFLESVKSRSRRGKAPAGDPLTDRAALERLLRSHGLDAQAHRLAHEVALKGLLLVPGAGRSHLGAPALLPPDEAWPHSAAGPLTFLAAIDLAETPLPHHGWLLFFASLEPDGGDVPNAPGAEARVFHTQRPQPADGPALGARALELKALLTLPAGYEAPGQAGLDVYEVEMLSEADDALAALRHPGQEGWVDEHWFGGLVTGVQGFAPAPGTVLLLHLAWDEEIGFEFLDAGVLQFRIPADALAAGDWSRVVAYPDSC